MKEYVYGHPQIQSFGWLVWKWTLKEREWCLDGCLWCWTKSRVFTSNCQCIELLEIRNHLQSKLARRGIGKIGFNQEHNAIASFSKHCMTLNWSKGLHLSFLVRTSTSLTLAKLVFSLFRLSFLPIALIFSGHLVYPPLEGLDVQLQLFYWFFLFLCQFLLLQFQCRNIVIHDFKCVLLSCSHLLQVLDLLDFLCNDPLISMLHLLQFLHSRKLHVQVGNIFTHLLQF